MRRKGLGTDLHAFTSQWIGVKLWNGHYLLREWVLSGEIAEAGTTPGLPLEAAQFLLIYVELSMQMSCMSQSLSLHSPGWKVYYKDIVDKSTHRSSTRTHFCTPRNLMRYLLSFRDDWGRPGPVSYCCLVPLMRFPAEAAIAEPQFCYL